MQIGDKVWIFDSSRRRYEDDKGNKTQSPWYRGYFAERFILGETKLSWIIGYKNGSAEDRCNLKVNKKTLTYKSSYGMNGVLYVSEEQIDRACWLNDNHYRIKELVGRCNDYDKLRKIEDILIE